MNNEQFNLHPRDFDPGQPIIKDLPLIRKFKSYVGLKNAESKLEKWLSDFESPRAHSPLLAAKSASIKKLP